MSARYSPVGRSCTVYRYRLVPRPGVQSGKLGGSGGRSSAAVLGTRIVMPCAASRSRFDRMVTDPADDVTRVRDSTVIATVAVCGDACPVYPPGVCHDTEPPASQPIAARTSRPEATPDMDADGHTASVTS